MTMTNGEGLKKKTVGLPGTAERLMSYMAVVVGTLT